MKNNLILLVLATLVLFACRKRDIQDPSYMYIQAVEQYSQPGQGTSRHHIDFVYCLISDNSIGTYLAPHQVPVLYQGKTLVEARPMIKWLAREGLHPYSLMKNYKQILDLQLLTVDTLRPVFEYQDNTEFTWLEDFNDNSASLTLQFGTFDSFYVRNNPDFSLDGTPYMQISMGNGEQFFEIESDDLFDLPTDGREVIMEIDYKTNKAFTIGLKVYSPGQVETKPSVSPYPGDGGWQKGYIYLTDELYNAGINARFRIFIRASNAEVENPEIFIDNIKLLYRKG